MDFSCDCTRDEMRCTKAVGMEGEICSLCQVDCYDMFKSQAEHLDEGKPELQYILAMPGLMEVAKVNNYGSRKYNQWNYRKGMPWMKLLGSCSRHLAAFICGEDFDKESGLAHLAHLCYDALMLLGYMKEHPKLDDRYRAEPAPKGEQGDSK